MNYVFGDYCCNIIMPLGGLLVGILGGLTNIIMSIENYYCYSLFVLVLSLWTFDQINYVFVGWSGRLLLQHN